MDKYSQIALLNMLEEVWKGIEYGHEVILSDSLVSALNKIADQEGWG